MNKYEYVFCNFDLPHETCISLLPKPADFLAGKALPVKPLKNYKGFICFSLKEYAELFEGDDMNAIVNYAVHQAFGMNVFINQGERPYKEYHIVKSFYFISNEHVLLQVSEVFAPLVMEVFEARIATAKEIKETSRLGSLLQMPPEFQALTLFELEHGSVNNVCINCVNHYGCGNKIECVVIANELFGVCKDFKERIDEE